jgi:hypothetical protein
MRTLIRPETWYCRWLASQLWVFTIGFRQVDHFHPGCSVARPKVTPPNVTSSNWPLSNERFSSGADKVFLSIWDMRLSLEKSADWSKSERRDIDGLNPSVDGLEGDLVVRWEIWLKA